MSRCTLFMSFILFLFSFSGPSLSTTPPPSSTCDFQDVEMCSYLSDVSACTQDLDNYVSGLFLEGQGFPGLQYCLTSFCCYCSDPTHTDSDACNTTVHDLAFPFGRQTLNHVCDLAPSFLVDFAFNCSLNASQHEQQSNETIFNVTAVPCPYQNDDFCSHVEQVSNILIRHFIFFEWFLCCFEFPTHQDTW